MRHRSSHKSKTVLKNLFPYRDGMHGNMNYHKKLTSLTNFRFKEGLSLKDVLSAQTQHSSVLQDGHKTGNQLWQSEGKQHKGWVHFFDMKKDEPDPKFEFFKNPEWAENNKKPYDEEEEDEGGFVEIPNETSFWIIVNRYGLFALTSRRNNLVKTVMQIALAAIKPIVKTKKGITGGCEDLGNFKEGFCWKVIKDDDSNWIMCTDSLEEKEEWMDAIRQIKGMFTVFEKESQLEGVASLSTIEPDLFPSYKQTGPDGEEIPTEIQQAPKQKDSYWKDLQDWSTCSLFCGGGTQTLHRECVLGASPDAEPCKGEPILTRPCNESPCPPAADAEEPEETLPMKVEMKRVSYRPQRYETCIIKEGDLEVVRDDIGSFQRPPRVPARAVLNNHTFSIFQTVSFDTILFSCELSNVQLRPYAADPACFTVTDSMKGTSQSLCSLASVMGITMEQNRNEWVQSIGFFKSNCQKPLEQVKDETIADIKRGEVEMEEKEAEQRAAYQSPNENPQMEQVAGLAIDALAKESKYEKLAQAEELDREVLEELEQRKQLEQLKSANECAERDKRKAREMQKEGMATDAATAEVNDMKGNIKNMVMNQRANSSKKIAVMKKLHDKAKRAGANQIQDMRIRLAKEAMAAAKLGDMKLCNPSVPASDKTKYCNENFDTDPDLNKDCKDPEQYCLICCENEIGAKHPNERNDCMKQCEGGGKSGNWVWVPAANAVKM